MDLRIDTSLDQIAPFCRGGQITELALFGSVLREDFGPDSDIDVLVRLDRQARHALLDIGQMENELSRMLGRDVDVIERPAIERSRNHIRRKAILDSAETIVAT